MKTTFILAIVFLSRVISAQDYQISFAVLNDDDAILDSVVVHNLALDQVISVQGDDILQLAVLRKLRFFAFNQRNGLHP